MKLKIKSAYRKTIVGYNNSGKPLGERDDLLELAIIARSGPNNGNILDMFEDELPSLEDLLQEKAKAALPAAPEVKSEPEKTKKPKNEDPETAR